MGTRAPQVETSIKVTLTAYCSRCKDIFTVWGVIKRKRAYIEPQSRIRTADGESPITTSNLVSLKTPLYHHCGCELKFYPDYRWRS